MEMDSKRGIYWRQYWRSQVRRYRQPMSPSTVNGKVVAKPCTVSTTNATFDLGDLYSFSLMSAGAASAWHDVALELTNCPVGTSRVTASFSGAADSTGYYKNQGTAQNIQLELQDDSGNTLNTGATKTVQVDDSSQSAHFPLRSEH